MNSPWNHIRLELIIASHFNPANATIRHRLNKGSEIFGLIAINIQQLRPLNYERITKWI